MADKRIKGITIEIDGETKGLDKALQDVNKRSREVSNELRSVERLLKFDPGNVQALAQKQQLLSQQVENTSKKLNQLKDAQSQVEQQFQRGDIGAEQYRAFQREIQFTQAQLNKYTQELQNMEQEQQKVQQSTKQLETLFKATGKSVDDFSNALGSKLTNAIKSGKASSAQLEEAIEKIGKEALGTNTDIDKMKEALKGLDSGVSLDKIRKELSQISETANESQKEIGELGNELTNLAGGLAAGGGIAGVIQTALDTSQLNTKIDITFDVPEKSKKTVKDAVNQITAYGVDAESALEGVRRQWALNANASDEANRKIVEGAGAIASAYSGIDFTELIQEVNEMSKEMGITNEEALGLTNSLLNIGFPPEQLDIIAEYGKQLHDAGFSAEEIQAIMAAGVETGTWNIDNLLDGLKEGRILLAEFGQGVDDSTAALLEGTGISTQQLQSWGQAVAEGGEKGRKAMQEAAKALVNIDDKTKQNALGVKLFGTMWEDQGTNITDTILNMDKHLADAAKNQENFNETTAKINADPAVKLQKAFSDLKTALQPLLSVIASVVGAFASFISTNPVLAGTITAVVGAVGILAGALMGLAPIFYSLQNVIPAITKALPLLGKAFTTMTGPIGLAVTALTVLVPLIIKNWEPIKEFFVNLWDGIKQVFTTVVTAIGDFLAGAWEGIKNTTSTAWNGIKEFFTSIWEGIKTIFSAAVGVVGTILSTAWETIKNTIMTTWQAITEFLTTTWDGIKTTAMTLWEGIKAFFQTALTGIQTLFTTIWNAIQTTTQTVWNAIAGFLQGLWGGIKNTATTIFNNIKTFIQGIWSGVQNITVSIWNGIKNSISSVWDNIKNIASTAWGNIKNFIMSPVNAIKDAVPKAFESMKSKLGSIWDGVKSAIKAPLNAIISMINKFISGLNKLKIPDWVPGVGGKGINIPTIPMLAKGTNFFKGGMAIVGEQGPELVELPTGSKVYPNKETMGMLGGAISINIQNMTVRDDNDIEKISRDLYTLIERSKRSRGFR